MAFNWDLLITILVIGGLVLTIWARASQQTIMDLLRDIREFLAEQKENAVEEIPFYEY